MIRELGNYSYIIHVHRPNLFGDIEVVGKRTNVLGFFDLLSRFGFFKKSDNEIISIYKETIRLKEMDVTPDIRVTLHGWKYNPNKAKVCHT